MYSFCHAPQESWQAAEIHNRNLDLEGRGQVEIKKFRTQESKEVAECPIHRCLLQESVLWNPNPLETLSLQHMLAAPTT